MTIAFLYVFMATLFVAMAASLGDDVRRNHYQHKPLRPMVMWIAILMLAQAIHFLLLSIARFYVEATGFRWPVLDGWVWLLVLLFMAIAVTGFYASFRTARAKRG